MINRVDESGTSFLRSPAAVNKALIVGGAIVTDNTTRTAGEFYLAVV
jgi:hypothetical protein